MLGLHDHQLDTMMNFYYNRRQLETFCGVLPKVFADAGFEIVEEPYIDYTLCGFRATFIRRYVLHQPTTLHDGILTTIIHTVGIPFGNGQKMVVLSAPRTLKNEVISETLKLRLYFSEDGTAHVVHNDNQQEARQRARLGSDANHSKDLRHGPNVSSYETDFTRDNHHELSIFRNINSERRPEWESEQDQQFLKDLAKYVAHIIEVISPGLIELPFDMKLEILKKLNVDSIIKMSQVNNEFRVLIFKHGESLWRHLCYRDFNIKFINRQVHKTWMELYRDTYLLHQNDICRKERALPGLPERLALPPVPYRYQIEWLPEVLALPFHPLNRGVIALPDNPLLALEFHPIHRAGSLDSLM